MKRIYIKLYKKNGSIAQYRVTKAIRRILSSISLVQFKKAYVKVSYGKKVCTRGCSCEFINDGYYTTPKELAYVIKMFWNQS